MRMLFVALTGWALAVSPALGLTVETKVSTEFQSKLEKDYGEREADILKEALVRDLEEAVAQSGKPIDRIVVTIEDAKPNRPTFQQVSDRPGLDPIRSISIGGARVSAVAFDASGVKLAELDYDWYETDITNSVAVGTWHDARWAFDRFARKLVKEVG